MIRAGDYVWIVDQKGYRVDPVSRVALSVSAEGMVAVRFGGQDIAFADSQFEVACHRQGCSNTAELFVRASGEAVCMRCAETRYHSHELIATRGNEAAIVACVCGESLDGLPGKTWDRGGVTCEYRTCGHCLSTRAYMPRNEVSGSVVTKGNFLTEEPPEGAWAQLTDALETHPGPGAELRRGRVVLARSYQAASGERAWHICTPTRE